MRRCAFYFNCFNTKGFFMNNLIKLPLLCYTCIAMLFLYSNVFTQTILATSAREQCMQEAEAQRKTTMAKIDYSIGFDGYTVHPEVAAAHEQQANAEALCPD